MLKLALLTSLVTANAYIWPSPQLDALEALRWDQDRNGITALIQPCDFFIFGSAKSGRSNAADWIRTVFHDMATHNKADGTGGMDASIRFAEEQGRPKASFALRDGFSNTVAVLQPVANRYISIADALAVGAILAIENCAGPEIAFRGGRVDAAEPNLPGVPEPQQDLDSHIASFARQGFTQTEMIGLVAYILSAEFSIRRSPILCPELNDPSNTQSVAHFDTTNTHFDNRVATEYIAGTTQNPLVVGLNQTTNSDKRIFGSDGNATMRSFANSPDLFASTCADLFARMIDTVPAGVQLTEVITPLPVKPHNLNLILAANNTIQFSGEVRLWNVAEDADPVVRLLWDDRTGRKTNNVTVVQDSVVTVSGGRYNAAWYVFDHIATPALARLDAVAGITSIRFTVDNKLEDQGGVGFAVQDDIMFAASSCFTLDSNNGDTGRFDVAVRTGVDPTRVYLEQSARDSVDRPTTIEIDLTPHPVDPNATFGIWSITQALSFTSFTIGAEIGGAKVTRGLPTSVFGFGQCSQVE
ncbi:Peroxidase [Mycena venus]|uniref:Peroxidase n=1 Tax=Mycena venus TaxID=2733690 RepID=A0A8H7CP02_9AGAR|nr:Peroxidase [Mycena venus]